MQRQPTAVEQKEEVARLGAIAGRTNSLSAQTRGGGGGGGGGAAIPGKDCLFMPWKRSERTKDVRKATKSVPYPIMRGSKLQKIDEDCISVYEEDGHVVFVVDESCGTDESGVQVPGCQYVVRDVLVCKLAAASAKLSEFLKKYMLDSDVGRFASVKAAPVFVVGEPCPACRATPHPEECTHHKTEPVGRTLEDARRPPPQRQTAAAAPTPRAAPAPAPVAPPLSPKPTAVKRAPSTSSSLVTSGVPFGSALVRLNFDALSVADSEKLAKLRRERDFRTFAAAAVSDGFNAFENTDEKVLRETLNATYLDRKAHCPDETPKVGLAR